MSIVFNYQYIKMHVPVILWLGWTMLKNFILDTAFRNCVQEVLSVTPEGLHVDTISDGSLQTEEGGVHAFMVCLPWSSSNASDRYCQYECNNSEVKKLGEDNGQRCMVDHKIVLSSCATSEEVQAEPTPGGV